MAPGTAERKRSLPTPAGGARAGADPARRPLPTLPEVLSLDPELRAALQRPLNHYDVDYLNRKLERANGASQSSTLTLINRSGIAVAASNWREARNNVGEDYNYRPYVRDALATGKGRFMGLAPPRACRATFCHKRFTTKTAQRLA